MTERSKLVRRGWGVLTAPNTAQLSSYPLDIAFHENPVRIAVDRKGHRHLLVPSSDETVAPDTRQHVLAMKQASYAFDRGATKYLDIECGEPELNAEFDDVVLDVLEALEATEKPAGAAAQTIERWRRLFKVGMRRSLSEQQRLGLFAELTILRELRASSPGLPASVWAGPRRETHDFELEQGCLEVKAVGSGSTSITIHGLDQMDNHDDRPLRLLVVTVVPDDDGTTLNSLVHELQGAFAGDPAFMAMMGLTGWAPDDPAAATLGYSIEGAARVRVEPGVPRLVRGSLVEELDDGIGSVSYAIGLAELLVHGEPLGIPEIVAEVLR